MLSVLTGTPLQCIYGTLEHLFLFWVMRGRASIWDCELCASIGGVHGGLGRCEREREREREREFNDFLFIFRKRI